MRLIDVAIPKFEDNSPSGTLPPKGFSTDFQLPTLFGRGDDEYHVDYDEDGRSKVESKIENAFFNVQDRSLQVNCPDVVISLFLTRKTVVAAAHLRSGLQG